MEPTKKKKKNAISPLLSLGALFVIATQNEARSKKSTQGWRSQAKRWSPDAWRAVAPAWAVPLVEAAAVASGVPAALIAAVARTESAWQPQVVSQAGAIGLMQLMPATAELLRVDPWDPQQNIMGGSRYLRAQLDRFNSVELALAAYNAGPHRVVQYKGIPPFAETRRYVQAVMGRV